MKDIIKRLYYPDSPYEFSMIPADILGQVYERFLGKVIRLTPGGQAKIEEKPEVRKAGGVYYTPTYIVDYIVKHTVGKLLEPNPGRKRAGQKDINKLRILDPACGSGSFLLVAYQFLLDRYLDSYAKNDPEKLSKKRKAPIFRDSHGEWRLTPSERKRILLDHIYGVDIDSQAVEVTKLSLLLKVLEGENPESLESNLRLFHERALPDLDGNVKCGNSLIGPDFYDNAQLMLLTEDEKYRINVFDWKKEFAEVFKGDNPGFDAVIGNPPYGWMIHPVETQYFLNHYKAQDYQHDLYLLFLEKYEKLLMQSGLLGVIVSNTWLQSVTYTLIRKYLASKFNWIRILCLPDKVFHATVDTHVLVFQRKEALSPIAGDLTVDIRRDGIITHCHKIKWGDIPHDGGPINIIVPPAGQALFRKIQKLSISSSSICDVFNGVKPFEKGKGSPPQTQKVMDDKPYVKEGTRPDSTWLPLLRGTLIHRYENRWDNDYWVSYGPWLAAPRDPSIFDAPLKIMVRQTGDSIIATIIESGIIARNNLHILLLRDTAYDLRYVLGSLNSSLTDFAYTFMNPEKGEALAEVKKRHVETLPIRPIDFSNPADRKRHDRMVELVDLMLDLHKRLQTVNTPHEKETIQRQIDATDQQIDRLVYELYELSEEEIKIV
ncbi:MAG TPA: TaqI-like C-terminal specificity domain-containing protein, partial [bacterium]